MARKAIVLHFRVAHICVHVSSSLLANTWMRTRILLFVRALRLLGHDAATNAQHLTCQHWHEFDQASATKLFARAHGYNLTCSPNPSKVNVCGACKRRPDQPVAHVVLDGGREPRGHEVMRRTLRGENQYMLGSRGHTAPVTKYSSLATTGGCAPGCILQLQCCALASFVVLRRRRERGQERKRPLSR